MRLFLTGGTGFIGQSLVKALRKRGWSVVALVRRPDSPQASALTAIGADCVTGARKARQRTVQTYAQWLANHEGTHLRQIERIVHTLRM